MSAPQNCMSHLRKRRHIKSKPEIMSGDFESILCAVFILFCQAQTKSCTIHRYKEFTTPLVFVAYLWVLGTVLSPNHRLPRNRFCTLVRCRLLSLSHIGPISNVLIFLNDKSFDYYTRIYTITATNRWKLFIRNLI